MAIRINVYSKKKKKKYFKNLKFKSKKSTFVTVSDVPYFQHYSCFLFDYVNILKGDQNKFNNHKHMDTSCYTHPLYKNNGKIQILFTELICYCYLFCCSDRYRKMI